MNPEIPFRVATRMPSKIAQDELARVPALGSPHKRSLPPRETRRFDSDTCSTPRFLHPARLPCRSVPAGGRSGPAFSAYIYEGGEISDERH